MSTSSSAARVVEALTAEGLLTAESEDRARAVVAGALGGPQPGAPSGSAMSKLVEVVAYLGGALVLAAGFLFLATTWSDLSDTAQVVGLAVVAVVLAVAGWVAAGRAQPRPEARRRLGGTLFTGAAVAAGFAVGVAIEVSTDHSFGDVYWPGLAGSLVAVAVAAAGYRVSSTAVGLLGILGGVLGATMNVSGSIGGDESLYVGLSSFVVGVVWLTLTELGMFDQRTIARALGVAVALFGAQVASFSDTAVVGYLLCLAVVGVGVWLYLTRLDWPYLAGAVVAVTLVVPEAVSDWTDGSLGVVGGVLVAGITLLGASFAGYRLRQEATD
jgi:hypothetical protein